MIGNYFKIAARYLLKNKVFAGINLLGLVTGLCVFFFALLYVNFELKYDTYNKQYNSIYRLVTDATTATGTDYRSAAAPMAPAIQAAFPEVKASTRFLLDYLIVQNGQDNTFEENIAYADSSLFSVFTLPLVSGNPNTVLNVPFQVVLSETAAKKYFGDEDPVGRKLKLDGTYTAYVTGIMKDMPHNSHFRTDMLVSMPTLLKVWNKSMEKSWTRLAFYTYLVLNKQADAAALQAKLPGLINTHMPQSNTKYSFSLEPLKDVYLYGKPRGTRAGTTVHGNIKNVYVFSIIAAFVLFIACFNFINLTTALSFQRSKEVGVRKVLGASKNQLRFQFLADAVLLSFLAFIFTIALSFLLLPLLNQLSGKTISTSLFENSSALLLLLAVAVVTGILSGIYPAFFLSGFEMIDSLKGRLQSGIKSLLLRKALVITQFSVSIILIIATLAVYLQLQFMKSQRPGYTEDRMLIIDFHFENRVKEHFDIIKQEFGSIPGVGMISRSSCVPGKMNHTLSTKLENIEGSLQDFQLDTYFTDAAFLQHYRVEVVAGQGFSDELHSDTLNTMLINETAAAGLGYHNPADAIGKRFAQGNTDGFITGVIKDFPFRSLHEEIQPLALREQEGWFTFLTVSISPKNTEGAIRAIKTKWEKIIPALPMIYFFADDSYNAQYAAEERFGKLFMCFATLAIIISCLGLFGLSAYSTAQRTKEIGIRKVLGAPVLNIVSLLSKDFLLLIIISFAISIPLAWLGIYNWLQNFAYRIELRWWIFAVAGIATILVAFITISLQTIKAALTNPVKSLKTE